MTLEGSGTPTLAPARQAESVLCAEEVSVQFEGLRALDRVSLEVRHNEVLGLIGPNGAGKTTLMNVLSGFRRAGQGRIAFCGQEAARWGPERFARKGVSRTFQAVRPFRVLTVAENVEAGALGVGASRRDARRRALKILRRST